MNCDVCTPFKDFFTGTSYIHFKMNYTGKLKYKVK